MRLNRSAWITQGFIVCCLIASGSVQAQIVPDGTLGNERSRITPIAPNTDRIDGGAGRGVNLFHSFQEFNVRDGRGAYFANPASVQNIFSRVTGGNVSNINGTLGVLGQANLFLLNPNGIIFGPNARLDIAGSFFASTASGFTFPDGSEFSATNPQAAPLLTVSLTPGLQRGGTSGAIANAGNLSVGEDLTLSGGTVTSTGMLAAPQGQLTVEATVGDARVRDVTAQTATLYANNNLILEESQLRTAGDLNLLAQNTVRVRDSVANPFVAWAGGKLLVQGNQTVDIFALNHPASGLVSGGDMVLRSTNTVGGDAHYWAGGSFQIEKLDGSLGNLSSPYDPIIRARGDVRFTSYTGASLHILAGGSVDIGSITITGSDTTGNTINPIFTPTLSEVLLLDGTQVLYPVTVNGVSQPTLDIRAGTTAFEPPGLEPNIPPFPGLGNNIEGFDSQSINNSPGTNISPARADIKIGSIRNASVPGIGQTLLTNRYRPNDALAGDIEVGQNLNTDAIFVFGDVNINSRGALTINGNADTTIDNPTGTQKAGDIRLVAVRDITINGQVRSQVTGSTGDAGKIEIISSNGKITSTKSIQSSTPNGNAGNVYIDAKGGDITAQTIRSFVGKITFATDPSLDTDESIGKDGDAGNVTLHASGGITLKNDSDSTKTSITSFTGNGTGGTITLTADGGSIKAEAIRSFVGDFDFAKKLSTGRTGEGGAITLTSQGRITVDGRIAAFTGEGNGGAISLTAENLIVDPRDAGIPGIDVYAIRSFVGTLQEKTDSKEFKPIGGKGNAGYITLNSNNDGAITVRQFPGADDISSFTGNGNGGVITLNADGNITTGGGVSSQVLNSGKPGNITLTSRKGEINTTAGTISTITQRIESPKNDVGGTIILSAYGKISLGSLKASTDFNAVVAPEEKSSLFNSIEVNSKTSFVDLKSVELNTDNRGSGLAGDIVINAADNVYVTNSTVQSQGKYGRILIGNEAGSEGKRIPQPVLGIQITNSTLSTDSKGEGVAGVIDFDARESVVIGNSNVTSTVRNGTLDPSRVADIEITGRSIDIQNSNVNATTSGSLPGGNIKVEAGTFLLRDSKIQTESGNSDINTVGGNAGKVEVTVSGIDSRGSTAFDLSGSKSELSTSTRGNGGEAGYIIVKVPNGTMSISKGAALDATTRNSRDGGNIEVEAKDIKMSDGGRFLTASNANGNAGKITVTANTVTISGSVKSTPNIFQSIEPINQESTPVPRTVDKETVDYYEFAVASAGIGIFDIDKTSSGLDTEIFLFSRDTDRLLDSNDDDPRVSGSDQQSLNSYLTYSLKPTDTYVLGVSKYNSFVPAGSLITGRKLAPGDTYTLQVSLANPIAVKKLDLLNSILRSGLSAAADGTGGAGLITVKTTQLTIENNAEISASTRSGTSDGIRLQGLDAQRPLETLVIRNNNRGTNSITASTDTGRAGDINIRVRDRLQATNGKITTSAENGSGGSINITARDIRLNGDSDIKTNVSGGEFTGGNITLNAFTILALGDSDILAYARDGRGGNISFGKTPILLTFRYFPAPRGTKLETLDDNDRVDINATGALGDGSIDFPDLDPSQGLTSLPTGLEDPSKRIDTTCASGSSRSSGQFVITGRGGLPPNPSDPLTPDATFNPQAFASQTVTRSAQTDPQPSGSTPPGAIVEAQGFVRLPNGRIRFVTQATNVTPQSPWQVTPNCSNLPTLSNADRPVANQR